MRQIFIFQTLAPSGNHDFSFIWSRDTSARNSGTHKQFQNSTRLQITISSIYVSAKTPWGRQQCRSSVGWLIPPLSVILTITFLLVFKTLRSLFNTMRDEILRNHLWWFFSIALLIPTAQDFLVISRALKYFSALSLARANESVHVHREL